MAIVRHLERITLDKESKHTEVDCTYSAIYSDSETFLQVDTYGSKERQLKGKKSQSIRFSEEAISELKRIISNM